MSAVCLENIDKEHAVFIAIGSYLYGCSVVLSNCISNVSIYRDRIVFKKGDIEIDVCIGNSRDCVISLNNKFSNLYQHFLKTSSLIHSYVTTRGVDPYVFTGMLLCSFEKGLCLNEAFSNVMETLSITGGETVELFQVIYSEFLCFNNLLNIIDELIETTITSILEGREVIVGCRATGNTLYISRIYSTRRSLNYSIERSSADKQSEYSTVPINSYFICIEGFDTSKLEEYEHRVINIGNVECVLSSNLINTLSLLKNIYS